jgi:hypothetical protein
MSVRHEDLHSNTTDTQKLSGGVWCDFPFEQIRHDPSKGWVKIEEFLNVGIEDSLSGGGIITADAGAWTIVQTASGTEASASATAATGVIQLLAHGNDNDEVYMGFGGAVEAPIDVTVSTGKPFWLESSLKLSALTSSFAFGLFKPAAIAAATLTDDTGVVRADTDWIGFCSNYTAGRDHLHCVTQKTSTTAVTVVANAGTLVADTYVRLGLKYKNGTLRYFVNGLEVGSRALVTTDITDGVQLTPMFAAINDAAGAEITMSIDNCAFGQLM